MTRPIGQIPCPSSDCHNCGPTDCPTCDGWAIVVCNCNAVTDDNFDVFINGRFFASLNLSGMTCVGGAWATSTNINLSRLNFNTWNCNVPPTLECIDTVAAPSCCHDLSVVQIDSSLFDPCACDLRMKNTKGNGYGNFGSVRAGCFLNDGSTDWPLVSYRVFDSYCGGDGVSFYYSLGGGGACSCDFCFSLWDCSTGTGVPGVVVTVGARTCTTDDWGACCIGPFSAGDSIAWSASYSGTHGTFTDSGTKTAACPGHNEIVRKLVGNNTITFTLYDCCTGPCAVCPGGEIQFQGTLYTADGTGKVVVTNAKGGTFNVHGTCGTHSSDVEVDIGCDATQAYDIKITCPPCVVEVYVYGCNGDPVKNASVALGGVGGTTDASGHVTLYPVPQGTQTIGITCSRFADYADTINVTNCANSSISYTANLTPASGYHCTSCSAYPFAGTLFGLDSTYGQVTMPWDATAGAWIGTQVVGSQLGSCCTANFTLKYEFTTACVIKVYVASATGVCGDTGTTWWDLGASMTTSTVPLDCASGPAPYFQASIPASACPPVGGGHPRAYPGSATVSVSE